jgi:hypothetical protein
LKLRSTSEENAGAPLVQELAALREERAWSDIPWESKPDKQGRWWHWNGDEDSAPFNYEVMWSGTENRFFVRRPWVNNDDPDHIRWVEDVNEGHPSFWQYDPEPKLPAAPGGEER